MAPACDMIVMLRTNLSNNRSLPCGLSRSRLSASRPVLRYGRRPSGRWWPTALWGVHGSGLHPLKPDPGRAPAPGA